MAPKKQHTIITILVLTVLCTVVKPQNITDEKNRVSARLDTAFAAKKLAEIFKRDDELKKQLQDLDNRMKQVEEKINDANKQAGSSSSSPSISPTQPQTNQLSTDSQQAGTPSVNFPNQPWLQALIQGAQKNHEKPQDAVEYPVLIIPDPNLCPITQPYYMRPYEFYLPRIENQYVQNYVQPANYPRTP